MLRNFYLSIFAIGLIVVASTGNAAGDAAGRQQLIDAMDAAWVRVLDDGTYRAIVNRHDMGDVTLNIVDCLPKPEVTPYPEKPEGTLRRILDEKRIKVGTSYSGETGPGDTASYFSPMGVEVLAAILAEIAGHYDVDRIELVRVNIPPPFNNTTALNDGTIDIIGQVNALGGVTEGKRRRLSRRFTCTVSGSRQILWVKKSNGPDWKTIDDATNDPDARLCAGPLSNQLTKSFFDLPTQKVNTAYLNDLVVCVTRLVRGEVDGMVSPFPDTRFFPVKVDSNGDGTADTPTAGLFRAIDTHLVAGTPFWTAIE